MTSFLEEIESDAAELDKGRATSRCAVCVFIEPFAPDQRAAWDAFLDGPRTTINKWRTLQKRGFGPGVSAVYTHVQNGHRK